MSYTLPPQMQEHQSLFNNYWEWNYENPMLIDIHTIDVKVGEEGYQWSYGISLHWEFWGPGNLKYQNDETNNSYHTVRSGEWTTLPMVMDVKDDVVRVSLLLIVYTAQNVPVEIRNIDLQVKVLIATETPIRIATESGNLLMIETEQFD